MLACAAVATTHASAARELPVDFDRPHAYVASVDGRTVAEHAPDAPRQPASLAKLAAALAVLDAARGDAKQLDAPVIVSARAASAHGARLGLRSGDRVRARELLAAMLVRSANDACLALAEHFGGTAERFVGRMNQVASRLGMRATRFVDPCGFDRDGQQTTAADMLRLGHAALDEPLIVALAQEQAIRVQTLGGERSFTATNTNALLGRYSGAFGLKTGYTRRAGQCVMAVARRGSTVALIVILGGEDRWPVAAALLDYAFDQASDMPRVQDPAVIGRPER